MRKLLKILFLLAALFYAAIIGAGCGTHSNEKPHSQGILFCGIVVDQGGSPIPGIQAMFSVTFAESSSSDKHLDHAVNDKVLTTNADGTFDIMLKQGDSLEIKKFEKPGYVFWCWDALNGNFSIGPDHRVAFHMLKQDGSGRPPPPAPSNTYQRLPYYLSTTPVGP